MPRLPVAAMPPACCPRCSTALPRHHPIRFAVLCSMLLDDEWGICQRVRQLLTQNPPVPIPMRWDTYVVHIVRPDHVVSACGFACIGVAIEYFQIHVVRFQSFHERVEQRDAIVFEHGLHDRY